ncbi:MAG: single-stranded-DNA-specific exonuclease RecJ [Phycisphaerales bacterium]
MKGLTGQWLSRAQNSDNDAQSRPLLERILAARSICDPGEVESFCKPLLLQLHPPGLLPGVQIAAERIVHAVRAGEPIVIYGDYDVDGVAGAAILWHIIHSIAPDARADIYIPHRVDEGYGLNSDALQQLHTDGARLAISVDCGITAIEPARVAREIGLDLIITDHHNPPAHGDQLPDALALVHPGLPGSPYPWPMLCGAGVAFKLAWQIATTFAGSERLGSELRDRLLAMLPLVALATIADVVPLRDENRVLTTFGLRLIRQTPIVGLRALMEETDLMKEEIDCHKVGFILGPHLNACGRMGHAREAATLLTCATGEEAQRIATHLASCNRQRQTTERLIVKEAIERAELRGMTRDDQRIIVLADAGWHPGVIGIVCSRLVDRFHRPVILLNRIGDLCRGSARSIEGYSIADALADASAHLLTHGGHDMAAGLSLNASSLDAFIAHISQHAHAAIPAERMAARHRFDCEAQLSELDFATVDSIVKLAPFGCANPRPVVHVSGVRVADDPKTMGKDARHLSLRLSQNTDEGDVAKGSRATQRPLRTVWWNGAQYLDDVPRGVVLDVLLEPTLNHWNGRTTVEAVIRDVRLRGRVREQDRGRERTSEAAPLRNLPQPSVS